LIPSYQPKTDGTYQSARRKNSTAVAGANVASRSRISSKTISNPRDFTILENEQRSSKRPTKGTILTQHTGLPPRPGIRSTRKK
jgi:hypothetical protein